MATSAPGEEYITIVPVGENRPATRDPSFVTVLTVGAAVGAAEVIVRRPRGARLGLGLKFEGGSAAAENVRRLLVQSCTEDSPAANALTPWGKLIPGDEILAIDGTSVSELTRIDCVRRLKDSDETLTLLVRHFNSTDDKELISTDVTDCNQNSKKTIDMSRPTTLPPPVPPRKLGKKNSFKDKQTLQTVGEQNGVINAEAYKHMQNDKESLANGQCKGLTVGINNKISRKSSFDSHLHRQSKESIACLKRGSPEEVRRLVRRLSDGKTMPSEAEVYIDLLSTEWERCLALADAESDDTGSSISTVVDRLGSMTSSVENSIPSTPILQHKTIDIQKVLNCIENIDTDILKDISTTKILENQIDTKRQVDSGDTALNKELNAPPLLAEVTANTKKVEENDKNNNNTIVKNVTCVNLDSNEQRQFANKSETKTEPVSEKPKPMPRSTKLERLSSEKKTKPLPIPEIPPSPVPDSLLTPTKKNCIETWLQRSEAEMHNGTEKAEEDVVPEALPRLIDFVPKPQYKENETPPTPMARPTSAPPPPPPPPPLVDQREDGSGASLDTIGELDETSDIIEIQSPSVVTKVTKERKSSYESGFWEDRLNKSDAEERSLSNDEALLPTCPRQPPDGVETPSDAVEKTPDTLNQTRHTPRLPAGWPTARTRLSYSRAQDARSEASVKDKIAMFSNDKTLSSDLLDKCGTLPSRNTSHDRKSNVAYVNTYTEVSSLDRRLTKSQDNLDEMPRSYKRHSERPEVLGALENQSAINYATVNNNRSFHIENKPLFYGSATTLPSLAESTFTQPTYHARSISDDNGNSAHRSNLEYLIEQRKKSMSKLRGLVIPEAQQIPIIDLPQIKVNDSVKKSFLLQSAINNNTEPKEKKQYTPKALNLSEKKWKAELLSNNMPKYSPAFKRKSLQIYSANSKESTPERKFSEKVDVLAKINNRLIPSKPPRISLDNRNSSNLATSTLTSKFPLSNQGRLDNKDFLNDLRSYNNVEIKICTATDIVDSDNDSAMSSTQSSYRSSASSPLHNLDSIESDSSRLSPRNCHLTSFSHVKTEIPTKSSLTEKNCEEYVKRNICRSVSSDTNVSLSSSAGSAATSGSQASCSSLESSIADSGKKKQPKACNIDTINRKNILASAKCRSGRDNKLNSPVIETKFNHESHERSPSPQFKSSERLSSLTPPVSAISNKGEIRRRNKVVAETDSDTDEEVNLRHRKSEFKNSRLKRSSSSSNKNKLNELLVDIPKVGDVSKIISEKIIQEIKKVGLDSAKTVISQKKNSETKRTESNLLNREENISQATKMSKPDQENNNNLDKSLIPIKIVVNSVNTKSVPNNKTHVNGKNKQNTFDVTRLPSKTIRLKRGAGSGVGLILAGGIDCEAKEVTIHRVLADSVADKAGLKRGSKVCSINGCAMAGLTHAQSVAILKEQRMEVVIEIEDNSKENERGLANGFKHAESKNLQDVAESQGPDARPVVTVMLEKAGGGAGLGFGLDGGRDSPQGDRPLTIKKLFAGGAAARCGRIVVGAELISAGGQNMENFTRTQAWAALKALPAGPVSIVLKNPATESKP